MERAVVMEQAVEMERAVVMERTRGGWCAGGECRLADGTERHKW